MIYFLSVRKVGCSWHGSCLLLVRDSSWREDIVLDFYNGYVNVWEIKAVKGRKVGSMKKVKVQLVMVEQLLGTASNNPDIHGEFVASKGPNAQTKEEEILALGVGAVERKEMTVFPRESGKTFTWDYQIKGFFKDACSALRNVEDTKSSKIKAFKKFIDGLVFVSPRKIMHQLPCGGEVGNCQRPLRGQTAQGERIALANSETVPSGTIMEFEITILKDELEEVVLEWLEYGSLKGLGGWRNSGMGRFSFKIC